MNFLNDLDNNREIIIKLKPYIKPFEKYLAMAEMDGLVKNGNSVTRSFSVPADTEFRFSDHTCLEFLDRRLAYWEKIGISDFKPTLQVLLESERGNHITDYQEFNFHKSRKLRYGPHGIHEYRGKFFPQLVKSLINFSDLQSGDLVVDPMCGSGTTVCEARSLGMRAIGVDLNPLSALISDVKASVFDYDINKFAGEIKRTVETISRSETAHLPWDHEEMDYLLRWFDPVALRDIGKVLNAINACKYSLARKFLLVCLSNIIRTVSWQKDSDLRVRKEIKEYQKYLTFDLFNKEVNRNSIKILNYLQHFEGDQQFFPEYLIQEGDSRAIDKLLADSVGKCDLLITSPPYAMALPYLDTDRLSLIVLNILPRKDHKLKESLMIGTREVTEGQRALLWDQYLKRRKELPKEVNALIEKIALGNEKEDIGFRKRNLPALLGKYFIDMSEAMATTRKLLKSGKNAFYVVGNNSTYIGDKKIPIMTNEFLWAIGKKNGWKQRKIINMDLLHWDVFSHNNGSAESILWFQK